MSAFTLNDQFERQVFANGYVLVNGVQMHAENGQRFQIPPAVLKKHVDNEHFVEIRIDSPRFSAHPDAPANCVCQHCQEEATKPILAHEQPATLLKLPRQEVPSRGWGEEFWVRVSQRHDQLLKVVVDNPLYEARLHELHQGDEIVIHEDHILAVHSMHRQELLLQMSAAELKELAEWLK